MKLIYTFLFLVISLESYCQLIYHAIGKCDTPVFLSYGHIYCQEPNKLVYDSIPVTFIKNNSKIFDGYQVIILRGNKGDASMRDYFSNGQLKFSYTYKEALSVTIDTIHCLNKDSSYKEYRTSYHALIDGPVKYWYKNGNMKSVKLFPRDGLPGSEQYYYPNGRLSSTGETKQIKDYPPYKTGNWMFYDSTGNKLKEVEFSKGDTIGLYKTFYPKGILKISGSYSYGKGKCKVLIVDPVTFEEKIIYEDCDSAMVKDGIWKYYDAEEKIIKTVKYNKGQIIN